MIPPAPFFTVIVPVYNVEEYLAECLDSILAQTFNDFELLTVNDGSPDGSLDLLKRYAETDPRLRVIDQPNQGVAVARNNGVNQARGRYIVHVDADDQIHPQLLETSHHFITTYEADAVCFDHLRVAPHTRMPTPSLTPASLRHHVSEAPLPLLRQRHRFRISVMAVMTCCKVELARQYPFLPGIRFDDYPYVAAMVGGIKRCVSLRAPLYGYTVRPGSVMMTHCSTNHIMHHRRALLFIADTYTPEPEKLAIITPIIYPELLKQIGNAIFRTAPQDEAWMDMLRAFRKLLLELNERGLISWRGHKLRRYLALRKLMRTEENQLGSIVPALSKVFH